MQTLEPTIEAIKKNGTTEPLRLDLGCGTRKREGFKGVDSHPFPGVDFVVSLAEPIYPEIKPAFKWMAEVFERKIIGYKPWPWKDSSVDEVHASHCLEHFERKERVHFFNELYRVMKPGAKATIITPDWCSGRAYGDMTHQWPAVSGFFWFYLSKEWRAANSPHNDSQNLNWGFNCNFQATWGPILETGVALRNQEYQQHAVSYYKEACTDMVATLVKC